MHTRELPLVFTHTHRGVDTQTHTHLTQDNQNKSTPVSLHSMHIEFWIPINVYPFSRIFANFRSPQWKFYVYHIRISERKHVMKSLSFEVTALLWLTPQRCWNVPLHFLCHSYQIHGKIKVCLEGKKLLIFIWLVSQSHVKYL